MTRHQTSSRIHPFAILLTLFLLLFSFSSAKADSRTGSYWYALDHLTSAEEDAQVILWLVVPGDWHGQEFTLGNVEPRPVAVLEDKHNGNKVIEWVFRPGKDELPTNRFFHFDFEVSEKPVAFDVDPAQVGDYDRESVEYRRNTAPETWIQTDGKVLDTARSLIGDETNPWKQVQVLYNWCVENLEFVPGGTESRDAQSTLETRRGDCGQFGRLFVAFCRGLGVPARTVSSEYLQGGSHVFAEVLIPGYGWVPADPSLSQMLQPGGASFPPAEVKKFMDQRGVPLGDPDWFLGHLFCGRVIQCVGNNITFDSPTLDREVTFQSMKPGGNRAHPQAVEVKGFNRDMIHGGFLVMGEKLETDEDAHHATHMHLANHYFNVGLYDMVEEGCLKSLDAYSDGVQPWINMGKVYMHKGEYYKAEAAFLRAMKGTSGQRKEKMEAMVWTHNYLGNCYDLLGHRDLAVAEYEQVIALGKNYRGAVDYARRYVKKPFDKTAP